MRSIVMRFCVSVPVLSAVRTSTPASSSMAASLRTIVCRFASSRAPTAMVTVSTAGSATGIEATVSTRAKRSSSSRFSCRNSPTIRMITTSAIVITISASPIWMTARWKWLRSSRSALATSATVRPK